MAHTDSFVIDRLPQPDQMPTLVFNSFQPEWSEQLNIVKHLFDQAHQKGYQDRPLFRSAQITMTYAEVEQVIQRMGRCLIEQHKLQPGQRVLLRGGNSIGMALSWLAVVRSGLIAVTTMPMLRAKELSVIITKAQPSLCLVEAKLRQEMEGAFQLLQTQGNLLTFGNPDDPHDLDQQAACITETEHYPAYQAHATEPAILAFTSGTTGAPKAAIHTHRDLAASCEAWPRHVLHPTPDDIVIGSPPLAFTFGLGGMLLFPLWAGCSVYYHDGAYTPENIIHIINREKVTICYTAPTFYRQMAPFARQHGVGSLRLCVSAGEGLPDATRQLWKQSSGIEMLDGIGATEMFHIFISSPPERVRVGAIGQVVPGYEARIVDETGQEVPHGTVGRLAVRGPTGCKYLDDERQTKYVQAGWNYPGDAFSQDQDGYFYYHARTDDMIVTAGYNVGGPEVEACLLEHPDVAECGVIGKPDEERGMIIVAFVLLKPHASPSDTMIKQLQDHVKHNLAPYKYPREVRFVTQMPRTETGKLQRFALRQQL